MLTERTEGGAGPSMITQMTADSCETVKVKLGERNERFPNTDRAEALLSSSLAYEVF